MTLSGLVPARPLTRGDIVLAAFPFSDLSSAKRRPAVLLGQDAAQGDHILAFLTSRQPTSVGVDEVALLPSHPEFPLTGLAVASKIRASKLVTLAPLLLTRRLGPLGLQYLAALDRALIQALVIDPAPLQQEGQRTERDRLITVFSSGGMDAVLTDLGLLLTT